MCWLWSFVGGIVFVGIMKLLYCFGSYLCQLGADIKQLKWQMDWCKEWRDSHTKYHHKEN